MENDKKKSRIGKAVRAFTSSATFRPLKRIFYDLLIFGIAYLIGEAVADKPEARTIYIVCRLFQLMGIIGTVMMLPSLGISIAVDVCIWRGWSESILKTVEELNIGKLLTLNKALEISLTCFSIWLVVKIIDTSVVKIFQDYLIYRTFFVFLHGTTLLIAVAGVIFIAYRLITKKDTWRSFFTKSN